MGPIAGRLRQLLGRKPSTAPSSRPAIAAPTKPPSTHNHRFSPVMRLAALLFRKISTRAISSDFASRPSGFGIAFKASIPIFFLVSSRNGVSVTPGPIVFTRIPRGARSNDFIIE
jgi:hypothetical protein